MNLSKAKKILESIKDVEKAVELTGQARKEYLAALDVVHGPVEKRAKDMGFGEKTYYHGSTSKTPIDSFDISKTGERTDAGNLGEAVYTTPHKYIADAYSSGPGNTYELKVKKGKSVYLDEPVSSEDITGKTTHLAKSLGVEAEPVFKGSSQTSSKFAKEFTEKAKAAGIDATEFGSELAVYKPQNIRSVNAAFDPRFADSSKIMAGAAAIPMGNQFANPADIIKSGYEKFEQARQSVVNKIADVTDLGLNENPYVPQHAKDTYNKAADALLQNVTDPLNAIPGFGAVDAAVGAAATGLDMYSDANSKKNVPQTSYVASNPVTNPVQTFKVKP